MQSLGKMQQSFYVKAGGNVAILEDFERTLTRFALSDYFQSCGTENRGAATAQRAVFGSEDHDVRFSSVT
jgi:hypothetical protein